MTIAGRINLLFIVVALFMGSVAATLIAHREYRTTLGTLQISAAATLRGHPDLQFHIYKENTARLQKVLADFLDTQAVLGAVVYSNLGAQLARHDQPGLRPAAVAPFDNVRGDMLTVDSAIVSFDETGAEVGQGFFASLFNGDSPLYFSLPVFTAINPGKRGLQAADFAIAINGTEQSNSQWVIGYLHVIIDRAALFSSAGPALRKTLYFSLLLAVITGLIAWLMTRRITRPLRELAALADDVAAGRLEKPVEISGSGEIKEIARVFNSVLEGLKDYKKERDVDKHLLSLKVEERSSQLNERNEALTRAEEQVNHTQHQLHHLANYDNLTKLPNRNLFTEQLELLLRLNRRNKHTLALLFIDLDDFKRVNDSLGISAGDQLLVEVGERLTGEVRGSDPVAHFPTQEVNIDVSRLGGDEFTVVLNQVENAQAAGQIASRLLQRLCQPMIISGHELTIKPSIGVALAPGDGLDVETLLRSASTAKQHAKNAGGRKFEFYSSDMGSGGVERIKLESDLRKAIEREELLLHYQPQVDTHSGSVVGAEALLRWEHPDLGTIPPREFIAVAEDIGIINELGDWVLVEACRQLKVFNDGGLKLPKVSINLSPLQFSPAFMQRIAMVLDETGLPPSQLELGLTEAVMTSPAPDAFNAVQALKESGVFLSVDDFGTGYSPLHYLTQFPLDELKIDRHFLIESGKSESGASLVKAIIALARSLNLQVLGQGVETEAQFHFLTDSGVHIIQGYLFSQPVPSSELRTMLAPWHFMDKVQKLADPAAALAR